MLRLENCEIANGVFKVSADLQIAAGSRVAVVGPSGAGKTTLIEAIAGFLPLTQGRILWQGQDLSAMDPGKRPVAMLFQDGNLFPHLTVAQNAGLGLRPNLRLTLPEQTKVQRALDRVGLADLAARKPAALSGGQQSRVALARVLLQRRDLLLLDEPFAALGPALKAEMLDLVAEIASETGATVLMVSHDPQDARRIADQVILVAEGQAHAPQPTAALLDNPPPALKAYLG
ncbi:thiamine ABC transporter ATP-binding protein [Pseudophaeobacter flagellatus]|uniref:thiamine ABC transporter ATP-binding protein n=1 Tax=Pseudophaeobacter flagellatus TaxID=2899119 RepID=UPI001E405CCB|nr:ATP-binding cassette domain-containing protein [Pseudophaeobacter flagellatus]MCD9147241.1 ATP-binding cassette domain-containing protein [Pseudophaeobacter flagellatus]